MQATVRGRTRVMGGVDRQQGSVDSYHVVRYRLGDNERYFIWYSGDSDGVVLSEQKRIAVFSSRVELESYAASVAISLVTEAEAAYDFDQLLRWLKQPIAAEMDCSLLLNTWNMLTDVARSVGVGVLEPQGADLIYDKLFRGCNLPAMTISEQPFRPTWSESEVAILARALSSGLQVFGTSVGSYAA